MKFFAKRGGYLSGEIKRGHMGAALKPADVILFRSDASRKLRLCNALFGSGGDDGFDKLISRCKRVIFRFDFGVAELLIQKIVKRCSDRIFHICVLLNFVCYITVDMACQVFFENF
jgi:hypothetical protein